MTLEVNVVAGPPISYVEVRLPQASGQSITDFPTYC